MKSARQLVEARCQLVNEVGVSTFVTSSARLYRDEVTRTNTHVPNTGKKTPSPSIADCRPEATAPTPEQNAAWQAATPGSPPEILAYRRGICRGCRYCGERLTKTRVNHGSCLRANCKQAAKDGDPGHPNRTCGCEPTNPEHAGGAE